MLIWRVSQGERGNKGRYRGRGYGEGKERGSERGDGGGEMDRESDLRGAVWIRWFVDASYRRMPSRRASYPAVTATTAMSVTRSESGEVICHWRKTTQTFL